MVVVVATDEDGLVRVRTGLRGLGVRGARVVAPSVGRRLVLATVDDEWETDRLVTALRAKGILAVARPDGGVRLEAWMGHTRPVTFGERLTVCPAWSEHDRGRPAAVIELGLGGFGNGQHPSTRLVVEELLEKLTGGERVLDVGCGSGVLGLCALGLGASRVVAVDVKGDAIEATRRNAALNGMDERVEATLAPLGEIEGAFDVVVANVGRAATVALAPELVRLVAPNGWLALSGISPPQCALVAGFLRPLVEVGRRTSGDWSALVLAHGQRSWVPDNISRAGPVPPEVPYRGADPGEVSMEPILSALGEQHSDLAVLLDALDDAGWRAPTRCDGWDVADVVLHLAQTDELAIASAQGRFAEGLGVFARGLDRQGNVDDAAAAMVARDRGLPHADVLERWRAGASGLRQAIAANDPHQRVDWVSGRLSTRTLATTRLAECWIHTGDVAEALGVQQEPTDRLEPIARLAWRTLPYAFARDGRELAGPVAFDLRAPSGARWHFLPESEPATVIEGPGADLCLVAGRRVAADDTSLRGTGPDAPAVLELVRTYA